MASDQRPARPPYTQCDQRLSTTNSLRPRVTRAPTARTVDSTAGTAATTGTSASGMPYSLAGPGPRDMMRKGDRGKTYVADGYRDLNPEYERAVNDPTFSLGGTLPHTVRKFMRPKGSDRKAVGVERQEKGETEVNPQLQNVDERTNRTNDPAKDSSQQNAASPGLTQSPGQPGMTRMRSAHAFDQDGRDLGTIGEEASMEPQSNIPDDERTLAPAQSQDTSVPFNRWAGMRRKLQDPLGEWLGTTVVVSIGISANLQVTTSQEQAGTHQSIFWAWGLATMLGIYIAGGSSGAHLNPAISIMLWIWRGFPARRVPIYILFQLLGAFTGAIIAISIYRDDILHLDGGFIPDSTGIAIYTQPKEWVKPATAFFTEAFATGILAGSILALGDDSNSPPGAGMHAFIIGLLVSTLLMAFSYNTGGTLNPVRDLGPRLAALAMGYPTSIFNAGSAWWIWGGWCATISGALIGAGVYDICIFVGGESPVNYSRRKWHIEGAKAQVGWFNAIGNERRASDIQGKLEAGDIN